MKIELECHHSIHDLFKLINNHSNISTTTNEKGKKTLFTLLQTTTVDIPFMNRSYRF